MFTRRTLLKRTGCAVLATAVPMLVHTARAQSASFNFYISPTGSDSNPGTFASPWSITALNSHRSVYAGKSVGVLPGTYNVHALCQAGNYLIPALGIAGGTSDSPTLIQSTVPRAAILTAANPSGGGYPSSETGIIGQGANSGVSQLGNVIIDGFYVTRSYNYAIVFYIARNGNAEGGTTGIEVRNCEVYDIGGNDNDNAAGIFFQACTGAWVHNCKIHSVQPVTNGQNPLDVAGIYSYACHANIYEYNTIYDCNAGIRDKEVNNGNHIYRYNYIEINGSYPQCALYDGAAGNSGDINQAYNNVLICPSGGGWMGEPWSTPTLAGLNFYNNTVVIGGGQSGLFWPGGVGAVKHYNNIYSYSKAQGYQGLLAVVSGAITLSDYNLYGTLATNPGSFTVAPPTNPGLPSNSYTLSGWQSTVGVDAHSAALNATFKNPSTLNAAGYVLPSGSAGSVSGSNPGRVGGVSSGALCDQGAWGGASPPTQIGCNFGPVPDPPVIISIT